MAAKASKVAKPSDALPVEGGRLARRRKVTRARLLEGAYEVMSEIGVDAAKIKDITDRADVGFGTFYNYFATKDQLANQVLDCVIDDLGRRNVEATRGLRRKDPALVVPVSTRLVMREAMRTPMWRWWALRPDLLADRMRAGFGPFAMRDIRDAMERGIFRVKESDIDAIWGLMVWMMVGGIHDVVVGQRPPGSEILVVNSIMRILGVELKHAAQISSTVLPKYPKPEINFSFELS